MAEHISCQAFVDFRQYNFMKPLEIWCPNFSIKNDNRSIWIGSWVFVITFEKVRLWPDRETVEVIIRRVIILLVYSRSYASLITSQALFSAVLLILLHRTSFLHGYWKMLSTRREDAHWTQSEKQKAGSFTHTHFLMHTTLLTCMHKPSNAKANPPPGTCWKECTVAE